MVGRNDVFAQVLRRLGLKEGEAQRSAILVAVALVAIGSLIVWAGWTAYEARLARRAGQLPRLPLYLGRSAKAAERLIGPHYRREAAEATSGDRRTGAARLVRYSVSDLDKPKADGTARLPSSEIILGIDAEGIVTEATLLLTSSARTHFTRQKTQDISRRVGFSGAIDMVVVFTNADGVSAAVGYAKAGRQWHELTVAHGDTWEVTAARPRRPVEDTTYRRDLISRRRARLVEEFGRINTRAVALGGTPLPMPAELRGMSSEPTPPDPDEAVPVASGSAPLPPARTGTHAGEEMYLVIVATKKTQAEALTKLDELVRYVGADGNTFSVDRTDDFQGLEPGNWIVVEGCSDPEVAAAEVSRASHGDFKPYVHEPVWKNCDDPITVLGP